MSRLRVMRAERPLAGSVRVPSDKSMSHRSVLFAAMAEGESHLTSVLDSADVRSTIKAVEALGAEVRVEETGPGGMTVTVRGWGPEGPQQPDGPIDCGNSGTTARLLMGVLAGWPIEVTLTGDDSLSRRPMKRVFDPLRSMGATFEATEDGTLPLTVRGGALTGIAYATPVASAQVKTAVLLAGLRAEGVTTVTEPAVSRDHTERMLPAFGVPVVSDVRRMTASVAGPASLLACDVEVPGDPSSAAYLAAAGLLVPGSEIELTGVGMNPTRVGFALVLQRMGADIDRVPRVPPGPEPVEEFTVRYTPELWGVDVPWQEIPRLVDEVPILAVVAAGCAGITRFNGVRELRVKEADRLRAVHEGLDAFGAIASAGDDWLEVTGPSALRAAHVSSLGDHRLAMTWAVAGLIAEGETLVEDFGAVEVSYPGFADDLVRLGASVRVE